MTAETPKRYRMSLSAQEVEQLLRQVGDKLNASAITQDRKSYQEDEVLSAKVANETLDELNSRTSGEGVKTMLENAPGVNNLTDELVNKINSLDLVFIGSFIQSTRDALVTEDFKGGEVILLLDQTDGSGMIQHWDATAKVWKTASILEDHRSDATLISAGVQIIQSFDKEAFRTATFTISARTTIGVQVEQYTIGWDNGTNVWCTNNSALTSGDTIFNPKIDVSAGGTSIDVTVTTLSGNARVQIEVQSLF